MQHEAIASMQDLSDIACTLLLQSIVAASSPVVSEDVRLQMLAKANVFKVRWQHGGQFVEHAKLEWDSFLRDLRQKNSVDTVPTKCSEFPMVK